MEFLVSRLDLSKGPKSKRIQFQIKFFIKTVLNLYKLNIDLQYLSKNNGVMSRCCIRVVYIICAFSQ